MADVVAPLGLQEYPVIVLPEEAVAAADTVALGREQLSVFETEVVTVGLAETTVAVAEAVHPFDCVTVTV